MRRFALVCVGGAVGLGIVGRYGMSAQSAQFLCLACMLVHIAATDLDRRIIPNGALCTGLCVRMGYLLWAGEGLRGLASSAVAGLAVSVPLVLVALVLRHASGRGGIGGGDVKLLFVVGSCLGWWESLWVVALACLGGIAFALARALRARDRASLGEPFTFGPFVAAACGLVVVACGP